MRTASHVIIETLIAHGVDRLFCVPGESHLGLLDALYDRREIDVVVARHEAGAGFMALADARLTGRPSVMLVSRGPGASNAAIAVHTAQQDAVPLVLLVGQVRREDLRRESFQEIDYRQMFGSVAKWTAEITDPGRTAEIMLRALQVATSGAPGPVVIALPEDALNAPSREQAAEPQARIAMAPDASAVRQLSQWLDRAERPLIVAGVEFDRPGGREALLALAAARNVPVAVSFRRHDVFPTDHPLYAGHLDLTIPDEQLTAFAESDLLVALGTRMGDITSQGYTLPRVVRPQMRFVHAHSDVAVLGRHFATDLAIASDAISLATALGAASRESIPDRTHWQARLSQALARYRTWRRYDGGPGIPFEQVVEAADKSLADDAIVTVDAGSFGAPVYRLMRFGSGRRLLSPISGAMGFGVPAAVAASLREPTRQVCCFVGDGGFLMTGGELAVALERDTRLTVIVSENGSYGSIRIYQERDLGGRVIGTTFTNPDLAMMGKAFGCATARLRNEADLRQLPELIARQGRNFIVVDTALPAVSGKGRVMRAEKQLAD